MAFKKDDDQYQASNELFILVKKYLKDNKLKFKKFCEQNNLPEYITKKVLDRKIKMHIFPSFIIKIGKCIGSYNNSFCTRYYKKQSTSQKDIDFIKNNILLKVFL